MGCSQKYPTTSKARQKATMRSYKVLGKRYYPTYVSVGEKMRGVASWYGPNFHGKQTSNGERYNMNSSTAAHKTWPMDTMVKVKNLQNGKSTVVRINDRGPFVSGRIIDCSYSAGKKLGLDKSGIAKVEIEVVGFAGKIATSQEKQQKIRLGNFGVQVGAFKRKEGAYIYQKKYSTLSTLHKPIVKAFDDYDGEPIYRVWIMGFGSEEEARDFIEDNNLVGAFLVRN
ncbi:MAG: septal ring lytic transglycosylase RlpA family protein [Campylobacterales bacterium]|nr:septal ring lytic transglycosylase RlpA family protein [Campylobacterales bacterium]